MRIAMLALLPVLALPATANAGETLVVHYTAGAGEVNDVEAMRARPSS